MIASAAATHNALETPLAYDREPGTRWTSRTPMTPDMAIWFTLDQPAMISGISATTPEPNDNPPSWNVAVMDSDAGHGRKDVATGSGPIVATWEPVRGQVVRIECTGSSDQWWWSITDLTITETPIVEPPPIEPPVVPPVVPPPDEEVGPATFNETLARYWVLRWAQSFNWTVTHTDVVDFADGTVGVIERVAYWTQKAKKGDILGVLEPFPFSVN